MSDGWKLAAGIVIALLVGVAGGYLLGTLGKGDLSRELVTARSRAQSAEELGRREVARCEGERDAARGGKQVLLARGSLLRALVEVQGNNYGLAGQHLGEARRRLKAAEASLPRAEATRVAALFEQLAATHTLVMRLDPMARTHLDRNLADVERLPGAR
ncbi:MAG: hypothetical protein IT371_21945 [Deltaproteobacteria bacterium]|nr:hypothetical protein [Deltaproteobacteria bacterium]